VLHAVVQSELDDVEMLPLVSDDIFKHLKMAIAMIIQSNQDLIDSKDESGLTPLHSFAKVIIQRKDAIPRQWQCIAEIIRMLCTETNINSFN
jgi:hypothetical protein